MKTTVFIILVVLLNYAFICKIINIERANDDTKSSKNESYEINYASELDLKIGEYITIEKYKMIVNKILHNDPSLHNNSLRDIYYNKVIDILTKNMPEIFPIEEIVLYLDLDKFKLAMNQAVPEIYSPEAIKENNRKRDSVKILEDI